MDKNCPVLPTIVSFGAKIVAGKFSNTKNKMADEIKLEAMKTMTSITSILMKLQSMLLIFISHRKTVENLFLQSSIKKGIIVWTKSSKHIWKD